MMREIVRLLAGEIIKPMQCKNPSTADYTVCEQHLREMFR